MFNKYFISVNECNGHGSDSRAIEKLGEKIEKIAKEEIKSKDRVDISLEEYQRMRKRIETLERKNSQRDELIIRLGIPAEVIDRIDTDSIVVYTTTNVRDFTRKYTIDFEVPVGIVMESY